MAEFPTTQLSLVLAAPRSQQALAELLRIYWPPLNAFVRRQGYSEDAAKDLTQSFVAHLLEHGGLRAFQRERGRFRSFLLASLKNFLANERDRAAAQKRGGGLEGVPLDSAIQPRDELTPERIFEKQWALAVLDRALERVQKDGGEHFERLRGYLTGEDGGVRYAQLGRELGLSEGAVKVAVHRPRRRFHEALREEIAMTVTEERQIGEELRYLLAAL
jgi:RNA polymerase sigma-70 factor (ECF subfamily)